MILRGIIQPINFCLILQIIIRQLFSPAKVVDNNYFFWLVQLIKLNGHGQSSYLCI
jgi:hypothetical protein